jgi:Rrf2 family nitric oxide-sensitive transcriptional repressor
MDITFSRRSDLALKALRSLAEADGRRMTRADLALDIGTTPSFVAQVVSPLVRSGWAESDRGPGGGYRIMQSAYRASLLEVVEATETPRRDARCVLRDGPCPGHEICPVHEAWAEAKKTLLDGLGRIPAVPYSSQWRKG